MQISGYEDRAATVNQWQTDCGLLHANNTQAQSMAQHNVHVQPHKREAADQQ